MMYITPNPSAVEPTFIHCLLISLSGERFASCRFEWFSRVVTSHARVFMAVLCVQRYNTIRLIMNMDFCVMFYVAVDIN